MKKLVALTGRSPFVLGRCATNSDESAARG